LIITSNGHFPKEPIVSTPLAPLVIEQIMREHMDRASSYRRAAPLRADRHRSVRNRLGALISHR
jgi:hypothetical protein